VTSFVVNAFQGLAPRISDRLLDPSQASFVTNLKFGTGDLRGFRSLKPVTSLSPTNTYRRTIRFYKSDTGAITYFKSVDVNASALKSPLAQDAFDRIYYTDAGETGLRLTTWDFLNSGAASIKAGIDPPANAPTVAPAGGTGVSRAYVYTYQTVYGSEGPPSDPTVASGGAGTWVIGGFAAIPPNCNRIRIYRSAAGEQSSGQYYLVSTITSTASFNDTMTDNLVPLQPPLETVGFFPPLDGIQGLIKHSSGAFAAFIDKTVYFSQPYLPNAWPVEYSYPVGDKIVGLAAILNYVVVLTKGTPYILAGDHPATLSIVKVPNVEPCTSNRSIVVMSDAVYFTSPNGLCSIGRNGFDRPTNPLLTQEEFATYAPNNILAAGYGSYYIAFYETSRGFSIALPPYEPVTFVPLDRYTGVTALDTDERTGELLVTQDNKVSSFDAQKDNRFPTTWRSKEFISTYPINLGAFQVLFKQPEVDESEQALINAVENYNFTRFAAGPLDVFNGYPINGVMRPPTSLDPILGGQPPLQPLGGEPLYDVLNLFSSKSLQFTMLADNVVRCARVITDEKVHSMVEGYKATRYYMEVSGSPNVQRIIAAETRRECRNA
jgi:hypothetical protein